MSLWIHDTLPHRRLETGQGARELHDREDESRAVIFAQTKEVTLACMTEVSAGAPLSGEWKKRGCTVPGVATDRAKDHRRRKAGGDFDAALPCLRMTSNRYEHGRHSGRPPFWRN